MIKILYNHICWFFRLDPALIRPGRVDLKEYIGHCSTHQIEQMFLRFYPGEHGENQSKIFAKTVESFGKKVSPAQIQGFFMFYKHENPDVVIKNCEKIWELWKC